MILLSLDAINSLIFVRYTQTTLLIKYELIFIIIWRSKTFWKQMSLVMIVEVSRWYYSELRSETKTSTRRGLFCFVNMHYLCLIIAVDLFTRDEIVLVVNCSFSILVNRASIQELIYIDQLKQSWDGSAVRKLHNLQAIVFVSAPAHSLESQFKMSESSVTAYDSTPCPSY